MAATVGVHWTEYGALVTTPHPRRSMVGVDLAGNLRVEKIDVERNLLYVRGAVAGHINGIVLVRKQG